MNFTPFEQECEVSERGQGSELQCLEGWEWKDLEHSRLTLETSDVRCTQGEGVCTLTLLRNTGQVGRGSVGHLNSQEYLEGRQRPQNEEVQECNAGNYGESRWSWITVTESIVFCPCTCRSSSSCLDFRVSGL